jgi:CheY-like chemotaxis protein
MVLKQPGDFDADGDEQRVRSLADMGSEVSKEVSRDEEDLNEVLSVAAHELRTPATVILGLAATLAASRERMSDEQVSEAVVRLDRQARRMVGLLEDLLDVSRMRKHHLEVVLEPVDVDAAVSAARSIAPAPPGKDLTVEVQAGLSVVADPAGLERVLVNLLTNAYRYGGANVRVEAGYARGSVHLTVTDDGPGVPHSLLPHLFKPFRAGPGGTGLGLSIVLGLVESFGGSISYERAIPGGARFDVRLQGSSQPGPEPQTGYASDPGVPVTILIVDDEPDVLFLLRLTLETAGYVVVEAAHGGEALESIRSARPALLVTDLMMPVMDGRELIRHVRETPETADLPVMLLSANPDHSSGADLVMRKPFNPRDLTRAIDELVGGQS